MFNSADDVLKFIKDEGVQFVDVRFTDLPGTTHHFTFPTENFGASVFTDGLMFDGSSIRGFQAIHESDMLLLPDPSTAVLDPFRQHKTLNINFFVHDPLTGEAYSRDPRNVARKAEEYLKGTGIADTVFFGPEAEFYIFDDVRFETNAHSSYYHIDSIEGAWNSGKAQEGGNLGYKPRFKGGYFPVPPMDHFTDLRSEMVRKLIEAGIDVEMQHHEVGTAGQAEIDFRFNTLLKAADTLMLYKYIVKSTALAHGHTVTFMPKPIFGDNGSGMHCHQSLWKDGEPLFYDEVGYAGLSDTARYYIGGLLKHAPSLLAFTNPTVNSYHRLVPGYEAPVNLVYSQRNRSACIRIPITGSNPKAKRIEFRVPDPSCNPYFAFAAQLMAGIDGIRNKIEPVEPVDKDLYELPPEEARNIPQVPGSLSDVLAALEADHEYLLEGGVFTPDLIETWIAYKRENEIDPIRLRPHPHEFELYYDV
ncbi:MULTISPECIES: type I glutamate--ammonia ligase [Streptosporangium]|uniref:Glutamine synthetase n=2 Tax=Streptosporangium TaxID=2000 RepID=D2B4R2_STRRD|nr:MULTISPECIES: type I glutamate--ammonia ligase [Streptosporangium]ACZ85598.1 glutamine synthetase, type I [Streptosporangium roseum DSM 43021]SFJ21937.1 L-glutamine synthetase [Streptosporangium canum]